jgi:hypothetical protein
MWEYELSHAFQKIANYKGEPPSFADVSTTGQSRYTLPSKVDMLAFIQLLL